MKKIVIAGGSGFIGKYLQKKFEESSCEVIIISRQKGFVNWNDKDEIAKALEASELLINLAGKSVNCRYNKKNKEEIFSSRTETTKILGEAIKKCSNPPKLWLNAGTATIYRHAEDRPMTEMSGEIGKGFSVEVAKTWEKSFFDFHLSNTRQVLLRIAIVLGKDEGVMKPMTNLVRFGLGGKQGNGHQMFSWIHIEDLYQIILFINENKNLDGIFNCSSPNPVTNKTLMQKLRHFMKAKIGLPSPKWLLKLGAVFING
ncbi:MAG: TIGR01777 family oxidoreductase [Ginsengibacter sp.]